MNTTTCLDRDQILDLCELIHTSRSGNLPAAGSRTLGLFRCIQVTLLMLRHNLTQELLADIHMVSQSTISRVVAVYTPLIAEALQAQVPGVGDLDPDRQYIIDGTLIERVIANLKTWRGLHTDYRRPYNTFETTIQAVTGLIFAYTP